MEATYAATSWWQGDRSPSISYPYQAILKCWYVLFVVLGLVHFFYYTLFSPIACVPGPFLAKVSRLWLAYHGYKGDFHRVLVDLHARYGDTVRIGPDEVSIANPDAVRKIYGMSIKLCISHPTVLNLGRDGRNVECVLGLTFEKRPRDRIEV